MEKREYRRKRLVSRVNILPVGKINKDGVNCLTCDISEGGIRIETDKILEFEKYNIVVANQKFPVRIIFLERLPNNNFLYGMMFTRPVSDMLVKEIIYNLNIASVQG